MISRSSSYFTFITIVEPPQHVATDVDALDWPKLHQRRDNRVVDCDRYSIFAELVAGARARQPIAGKIQLALPTFPVIALQIARRVKA